MTGALARKDLRVASESASSYRPPNEKMRALIVDDDRTLREGCASVLRTEGFSVEVAGRGEEAIEMIRRSRYDIMFVDVYMTPVSGIDVLRTVMATAPNTLVVLMTGNPSVDSSIEAMQIGAWDYLSKPYTGTQLQLILGRAAHTVSTRRDTEGFASDGAESEAGSLLLGASAVISQGHRACQESRANKRSGDDRWRDRHRQGNTCSIHSSAQPSLQTTSRSNQLRSDS